MNKKVSIIMGSESDLEVMSKASEMLKKFNIPCEMRIISAHRDPKRLMDYIQNAESTGTAIFIAGAGVSAHLPGVTAACTVKPVIGVPIVSGSLQGLDALYSIVQMPKGIPVATVALNNAANAALLAISILSVENSRLEKALLDFRQTQREKVQEADSRLQSQN